MNQQDAFKLLARASAIDNRKVTDLAAAVWSDTLLDMPYEEASGLMDEFRRENPDTYLAPGHLVKQKRIRIARNRELNGPHPAPPPGKRWAADVIETDPLYGDGPGGVLVVGNDNAS